MITSIKNPQMKHIIQLQKKPKVRNKEHLFVVEGLKMFLEAPLEQIVSIYVSAEFAGKDENQGYLQGRAYEIVDDRVFKEISATITPQGVLCVIRQFTYHLQDMITTPNPCLILLENLQDPGNLGTIIRTGEGAGVSGVILSSNSVDVYNPKTIRSTMGSIYRVPFIYVDELRAVLPELDKAGITTYAAHLAGEKFYDELNYRQATAFMIGNEATGLSEETAKMADIFLKIPMAGQVESLNAGIATAILLYECRRQRKP